MDNGACWFDEPYAYLAAGFNKQFPSKTSQDTEQEQLDTEQEQLDGGCRNNSGGKSAGTAEFALLTRNGKVDANIQRNATWLIY